MDVVVGVAVWRFVGWMLHLSVHLLSASWARLFVSLFAIVAILCFFFTFILLLLLFIHSQQLSVLIISQLYNCEIN